MCIFTVYACFVPLHLLDNAVSWRHLHMCIFTVYECFMTLHLLDNVCV